MTWQDEIRQLAKEVQANSVSLGNTHLAQVKAATELEVTEYKRTHYSIANDCPDCLINSHGKRWLINPSNVNQGRANSARQDGFSSSSKITCGTCNGTRRVTNWYKKR